MRLRKPGSRVLRPSKSTSVERARERQVSRSSANRPADRRQAVIDRYGKGASFKAAASRSAVEILSIAQELVRIPAEMYLGIAERLGAYVLAAWLWLWPFLVKAWHLAGRIFVAAQSAVTPARAAVAVALACAAALAGSQWADLSAISVGTTNYIGLEDVVSAPPVSEKTVGSSHTWAGVPLAILAALLVAGSARGRPKLVRLLIPVGLAVVAMSIFVDRPKGLDEGNASVAYESVTAELLAGFWAQLVSGVVLILLAPVLLSVLGPERTQAETRTRPGRETLLSRRRPRRAAEAGQ